MIKIGTTFEVIAGSYRGYKGVVRSHISPTSVFADIKHPSDPALYSLGIVMPITRIVFDGQAK